MICVPHQGVKPFGFCAIVIGQLFVALLPFLSDRLRPMTIWGGVVMDPVQKFQ
jgi:hypothetical protein